MWKESASASPESPIQFMPKEKTCGATTKRSKAKPMAVTMVRAMAQGESSPSSSSRDCWAENSGP